ncbi:MAG: methanogenesis marker 15 protein, partial [Euryarchaeota archaeon]|nr:methanogenesis marker 15 protein [Euryarchaeota archaeon]
MRWSNEGFHNAPEQSDTLRPGRAVRARAAERDAGDQGKGHGPRDRIPPAERHRRGGEEGPQVRRNRGALGDQGEARALGTADRSGGGRDHHGRYALLLRLRGLSPHQRDGQVPAEEARHPDTRGPLPGERGGRQADGLQDQAVSGGIEVIRVAQLSCGTEYSGVQSEIERAASSVGAEMVAPDIDLNEIDKAVDEFGFAPSSPQLRMLIARAVHLAEGRYDADAVFIASCFRCAEGALVRNEVRRYIQHRSRLPVVTYSFTERTKAGQLLTRMEALVTIVSRKDLLARERQVGLTMGIDSGSSTTKAMVLRDNEIIGKYWHPTGEVLLSAEEAVEKALQEAGVKLSDVEAIGVTGYGRFIIGKKMKADLTQEELTVNSKGAVWLANRQKGEATIIDIGGMDNKAITVRDGIPDNFTMGGICAGASGRFLEIVAKRLKVEITELGKLADAGNY